MGKRKHNAGVLNEYYIIPAGIPKPINDLPILKFKEAEKQALWTRGTVVTNRSWLTRRGFRFKRRQIPSDVKARTEEEKAFVLSQEPLLSKAS